MPRKISHIIDLEEALSTHRRKLIALCFYVSQNIDCVECYNILRDLENSYKGRAVVYLVDAEKFYHLTAEYEILDFPTVALIKNRTLVGKYCGTNEKHLNVLFSMHSAPVYFTLFQHENKSLRWPGPYEEDETLDKSFNLEYKFFQCLKSLLKFLVMGLEFITMKLFKGSSVNFNRRRLKNMHK